MRKQVAGRVVASEHPEAIGAKVILSVETPFDVPVGTLKFGKSLVIGDDEVNFAPPQTFSVEVTCPRCRVSYIADESRFKVDRIAFSAKGDCPRCQLETVIKLN
jgi:hypothetical protein